MIERKRRGDLRRRARRMQVPIPVFEIRRAIQAVVQSRGRACVFVHRGIEGSAIPDVVAAFLAFRIGIERRTEAAAFGAHLPLQPADDAFGGGAEIRSVEAHRCFGVHRQQLRVVVKHLLEMRDVPALVHAITEEASGQLIVQAARGHAFQRERRHASRFGVAIAGQREQ